MGVFVQFSVQMPGKGVSGVHRPVTVTWTGAGAACDCFLTESDSLRDLSSSGENRNA